MLSPQRGILPSGSDVNLANFTNMPTRWSTDPVVSATLLRLHATVARVPLATAPKPDEQKNALLSCLHSCWVHKLVTCTHS